MKKIYLIFSICLIMMIASSCTKKLTVTIIYNQGYSDETYVVRRGQTLEEPTPKTCEHKTLIGYYTEYGELFSFDTLITQNLTLYAKWQNEQITVTFYDEDRTTILYEVVQDYGTKLIYPSNPLDKEYTGYTKVFFKWSYSIDTLTTDKTVYAMYQTVYDSIDIIVKNQDLEIIDVIEAKYSSTIDAPELPTITKKDGVYYEFIGWYDEATNELFDFDEEIYETHTIYPKYEANGIIETTLSDARISFIGDSITTFYSKTAEYNSFYKDTNEYFYPIYSQTVKTVDLTWWYQTYQNLGVKFGFNNALSGSAAYGLTNKAGCSTSRLGTLDHNGIPNIVVIFFGTNDNVNGHTVLQLEEAYEKMITYINTNFVEKRTNGYVIPKIYLINNGYSEYEGYNYSEAKRLEYNTLFNQLSNKYQNVSVFDLAALVTKDNYKQYLEDRFHYNNIGMKLIADHLSAQIKLDFSKED